MRKLGMKVQPNDCLTRDEYYALGMDNKRPTCSPHMTRHTRNGTGLVAGGLNDLALNYNGVNSNTNLY